MTVVWFTRVPPFALEGFGAAGARRWLWAFRLSTGAVVDFEIFWCCVSEVSRVGGVLRFEELGSAMVQRGERAIVLRDACLLRCKMWEGEKMEKNVRCRKFVKCKKFSIWVLGKNLGSPKVRMRRKHSWLDQREKQLNFTLENLHKLLMTR